jgi:hypothetical protein
MVVIHEAKQSQNLHNIILMKNYLLSFKRLLKRSNSFMDRSSISLIIATYDDSFSFQVSERGS